jgi:major type 1 subunit fimbrin (pilin)
MKKAITNRKNLLIAAAVALPVLASAQTISFRGEVSDQTCSTTIDGRGDMVVVLPRAKLAELDAAGKTAGDTTFKLGLSGCQAKDVAQAVRVRFTAPVPSTPGGNIKNLGSAKNVGLALYENGNKFDMAAGHLSDGLQLEPGATAAEAEYTVKYIAEGGAVTPGDVVGSAQVTFTYN